MKRLAVLGWTSETEQLLRVWFEYDPWRIVTAAGLDLAALPHEWRQRIPRNDDCHDWFDGVDADAVVVSAETPGQFDDTLRRLAGQGIPMLMLHPACDSLMAHELQMLYPALPAPLLVWYPQRRPQFEELLRSGGKEDLTCRVGAIERITWTSLVAVADEFVDKRELVRAAHWCSAWLGRYRSMQALAPGDESIDWSRLSARISSHDDVAMEWQIKPVPPEGKAGDATVAIQGSQQIELHYAWQSNSWAWRGDAVGITVNPETSDGAIRWTCRRLADIVDGTSGGDDWSTVCQALEVADQVEYTIRRRRVVDLVQETPSEEAAFKGVMAAGSCALLLVVLAIFAFGSLYESVVRDRPRPGSSSAEAQADSQRNEQSNVRWWRYWPVVPLALYLLLQGLIFVTRQERHSTPAGQPATPRSAQE